MMGHFRTLCSCGGTIEQCRCPSLDRVVRILERGCTACKKAEQVAAVIYETEQAVIYPQDESRRGWWADVSQDGKEPYFRQAQILLQRCTVEMREGCWI